MANVGPNKLFSTPWVKGCYNCRRTMEKMRAPSGEDESNFQVNLYNWRAPYVDTISGRTFSSGFSRHYFIRFNLKNACQNF